MSQLGGFFALAALEIGGLFVIWFLIRARVRRYLELENLLAGVREEARSLVLELNETADRNVSLIEDRLAALRSVLDEVDRRIGLERREISSRDKEKEVYARLNKRRPIVPSSELELSGLGSLDRRQEPAGLASEPIRLDLSHETQPSAQPGAQTGAQPASWAAAEGATSDAMPHVELSKAPIVPGRTQRDEALDLYRQGFSPDLIAARLGATVSEIELLVEIEERRASARGSPA
jgi:hypothetical protein